MLDKRENMDKKLLEAYEDLTRVFWLVKDKLKDLKEDSPQYRRLAFIERKLATERRLIEEVSLPCRLILEHFSTFMGKTDQTLGYKVGQFQVGRAILSDFYIEEWGNVILQLGNVQLTWRDEDYKYLFYPDKVILRSCERNKPEIQLYFSFSFKYSHVLEEFSGVENHPQVAYWNEDLS